MYYRVAIQADQSPTWQWKSTALSSLDALFQFLRLFRALPQDRLRVFSSPSREDMNEQLARENMGYGSTSVPATQFLQERRITSHGVMKEASAGGTSKNERTTSIATLIEPPPCESSSPPEKRREELERGAGSDHDLPYSFALPPSIPQVLAWMRLLAKVQRGELQP